MNKNAHADGLEEGRWRFSGLGVHKDGLHVVEHAIIPLEANIKQKEGIQ
jgi:hypothetical protein